MTTNFEKMSRADLARCFGVTARSVGHWVSQGCPVNRDGTMACHDVYAWRLARLTRTGYLATQQALLAKARAELLELTLAERRAQLLPASEVRRLGLLLVAGVRKAISTLPDTLAAKVAKLSGYQETRNAMSEIIDDKLREISTAQFVDSLADRKP